ncbi:NUDIX hydrolase N-terminal domain-containing protein [Halalkalicoccus salilacus]|uniref:NUDIX hydrolase N-terminal domain-containing protein n=1 Tax=Halalkalicoccus salilacus TaxID=3117459 RepID=UPI0038D4D522
MGSRPIERSSITVPATAPVWSNRPALVPRLTVLYGPASLLDELRTNAKNGLRYADDPYDEHRYGRILDLVVECYQTAIRNPTSSAPVMSACIALEASIPTEV